MEEGRIVLEGTFEADSTTDNNSLDVSNKEKDDLKVGVFERDSLEDRKIFLRV